MGLRLSTHQTQRLLPRMLQSVEILQLPTLDLDAWLARAAQENETLRVERLSPGPASSTQDDPAWWESCSEKGTDLTSWLEEQLGWLELEGEAREWVRLVIQGIDGKGYLVVSDEELLRQGDTLGLQGSAAALGKAIAVVQGMEPQGVGGRNAVESLLLQLDPRDPEYGLLCRLLEEFLEELADNRLPAVARELGVGLEDLGDLMGRLSRLDPAPGTAYSGATSPRVKPEVVVEATEGGFEVRIDGSGLPAVTLDPEAVAMAADRTQPPEVRSYLRRKLERARWIVAALEQRKETLLRVAQRAFHEQRGFLERGHGALRPLRMGQVAEGLGLHLSTVSRSIAGKYAETPWGTITMRSLFPAAGGDGSLGQDELAGAVRAVIASEDASHPLSDEGIAEALAARGMKVARRTVTKYRKDLGIPSSYRRRRSA